MGIISWVLFVKKKLLVGMLRRIVLRLSCASIESALLEGYSVQLMVLESVSEQLAVKRNMDQ